ncbi:pentapeptide repeat-containing protein [candidate division KSB1 bacterium]
MPQCRYIRRDGSLCPEETHEESLYCFWHDEKASKTGDDIKAKLEEKVKRDPNCEGYKLKKARFHDVWLTETNFNDADFSKADLSSGHLFGISLRGANLFKANCSGANLRHAQLKESNLLGTNFENTKLGNVEWSADFVILQELQGDILKKQGNRELARKKYKDAEEIYVALKKHFDSVGDSDTVGKFFYRQMIVQRQQIPLLTLHRFFMKLADVSCGYGEKVGNIFSFSIFVIAFNALIYSFAGVIYGDHVFKITLHTSFPDMIRIYFKMLYYSTVTFTTLGYGEMTPISTVSRFFAGIEAFMGAFLVALFVIAVYKNLMSR